MDAHGQSWVGRVLKGRYRVEAALRAGGMGAVYKAVDQDMAEKPVVVKHPLRPVGGAHSDTQDRELRKRFSAEVAKLIDLDDLPGVVRIRDQGIEDGTPYFVMDFMAGGSIHDRLDQRRDSPMDVLRWAKEVAATLDEIHARGLVHRDIKPQNLLFQREGGRALIGDFGIVKELAAEWGTTGPANTQIGTPGFMALEQLRPDMVVDGRCDQYSLAATMYVALTGKPLTYETTGGSPARTPSRGTGRKALRAVNAPDMAPHVPVAAAAAVTRGLEPDRDDRFDMCAALVEAYEEGLSPPVEGTRTVERTRRPATHASMPPPEPSRRSRALPMLALLALVGVGGFFGLKALGVIGGGAGDRPASKETAGGGPAPAAPAAAPSPAPATPESPTKPPKPPESPAAAYEGALGRAKAAMAEGDGSKAKTALAEAVAADAPKRLTAEVETFVAGWEAAPVVTITEPAKAAEIEAEAGTGWTIAVKGTLTTGRRSDRLYLEDREIARDAAGGFAFTTTRTTAGPLTLTLEVRDGTSPRARASVAVVLRVKAPPAPPTPPAATLPAWAVPLLSQAQKDEAQRLNVAAAFEEPTTGMKFVLIPGGSFQMGSPESEARRTWDEVPQHRVTVAPFYLSVYETTNAQFLRFQAGHKGSFEGGTRPVESVGPGEATDFAAWLSQQGSGATKGGYRLPSEAEWEYACRAGTTTRFSFGDDESRLGEYGWYDANSGSTTHPVGEKRANPWGLYDVHGNVWEWCADDRHETYAGAPTDGSAWINSPRDVQQVARGGGWDLPGHYLRSADRYWSEPSNRGDHRGFRLARAVTPAPPEPVAAVPPTPPTAPPAPAIPSWAKVSPGQIAEARRLGVDVAFEETTTGMKFVLIPGGSFMMGSPESEALREGNEGPQHRVTLTPFYLQTTETTNAQYRSYRADHLSGSKLDADDQPVVRVSHDDATAFHQWLSNTGTHRGTRLPTEAEWEYACRAGTTHPFSVGATIDTDQANYDGKSFAPYPGGRRGVYRVRTLPVGTLAPNAWGLHDMHGNAAEICSDWMGAFTANDQRDPSGAKTGSARVLRGGSWTETPTRLRSAFRSAALPGNGYDFVGFRTALPVQSPGGPIAPATPPRESVPSWAKVSPEQIAEAKRLGVEVAFDEPITGMRFVLVPGGSFQMGSREYQSGPEQDGGPQHRVTVQPFYFSICETTAEQYRQFQRRPSRVESGAQVPATGMLHRDAEAFSTWLTERTPASGLGEFRLPSEAEWEYACRAGTGTRFTSGDTETSLGAYAWHEGNSGLKLQAVGQKRPNGWGLFDVHGNVWEWCADDFHATYAGAPVDGSPWIDELRASFRVARGGGVHHPPRMHAAAFRASGNASVAPNDFGFRLARSIPPK